MMLYAAITAHNMMNTAFYAMLLDLGHRDDVNFKKIQDTYRTGSLQYFFLLQVKFKMSLFITNFYDTDSVTFIFLPNYSYCCMCTVLQKRRARARFSYRRE